MEYQELVSDIVYELLEEYGYIDENGQFFSPELQRKAMHALGIKKSEPEPEHRGQVKKDEPKYRNKGEVKPKLKHDPRTLRPKKVYGADKPKALRGAVKPEADKPKKSGEVAKAHIGEVARKRIEEALSEGDIGAMVDLVNQHQANQQAKAALEARRKRQAEVDAGFKKLYPNGVENKFKKELGEDYEALVKELAIGILDEGAPVKVGQNLYYLSSLKDDKERAHVAKTLAAQNDKIDNLSAEEKANRKAQFDKSIEGTAKKKAS